MIDFAGRFKLEVERLKKRSHFDIEMTPFFILSKYLNPNVL
jgi:hypothetical protein